MLPIGEAYRDYFMIMLSESGKMYGAFEVTLRKEGDTFEEGIEALIYDLETPEIK